MATGVPVLLNRSTVHHRFEQLPTGLSDQRLACDSADSEVGAVRSCDVLGLLWWLNVCRCADVMNLVVVDE